MGLNPNPTGSDWSEWPDKHRMKFWFVRHGESEHNANKLFCGQLESKLTSAGIAQAHEAAQFLSDKTFDWIIASPLQRTVQTAETISAKCGLRYTTDKRLSGQHKGILEGAPYRDMTTEEWNHVPESESLSDVYNRITSFFEDNRDSEGTGVIVSHASVARVMLAIQNGTPVEEIDNLIFIENANPELITITH